MEITVLSIYFSRISTREGQCVLFCITEKEGERKEMRRAEAGYCQASVTPAAWKSKGLFCSHEFCFQLETASPRVYMEISKEHIYNRNRTIIWWNSLGINRKRKKIIFFNVPNCTKNNRLLMVKQSDRDCLEFISNCTFYLHLRVDNELHSEFLFDIKWTSIN